MTFSIPSSSSTSMNFCGWSKLFKSENVSSVCVEKERIVDVLAAAASPRRNMLVGASMAADAAAAAVSVALAGVFSLVGGGSFLSEPGANLGRILKFLNFNVEAEKFDLQT